MTRAIGSTWHRDQDLKVDCKYGRAAKRTSIAIVLLVRLLNMQHNRRRGNSGRGQSRLCTLAGRESRKTSVKKSGQEGRKLHQGA